MTAACFRRIAWQFWLLFVGFILTFGPMHVTGWDMLNRIYTIRDGLGILESTGHSRGRSGPSCGLFRLRPDLVSGQTGWDNLNMDSGVGDDLSTASL